MRDVMIRKGLGMVVHQHIDAHTIARHIVDQVRDEPDVQEIWLNESPELVDLWLITGPINDETELRLYDKTGATYRDLPAGRFRLHVIHPAMFADGTDLRTIVARGAKRVVRQP